MSWAETAIHANRMVTYDKNPNHLSKALVETWKWLALSSGKKEWWLSNDIGGKQDPCALSLSLSLSPSCLHLPVFFKLWSLALLQRLRLVTRRPLRWHSETTWLSAAHKKAESLWGLLTRNNSRLPYTCETLPIFFLGLTPPPSTQPAQCLGQSEHFIHMCWTAL
jgi:hypothetical protein